MIYESDNFMIPYLKVKCPKCKAVVTTTTRMNMQSFRYSGKMRGNVNCKCSRTILWDKDDVLAISFC